MQVLADASLQQLNTLGLPSRARWLAHPSSAGQLIELLQDKRFAGLARIVIGEGSNLLLRPEVDALVIRPDFRGISVLEQDADSVLIEASAGENWDALVAYSLTQGWYGLENLSLIPGTVGAAPFQNIGAYGVELSDRFDSLTAVHLISGEQRDFSQAQCQFGYRDSLFKSAQAGCWLITAVRLRLSKAPQLVLQYADLQQQFDALPLAQQTPQGVRDLICALRRAKLPDPALLANAGSFFKNPSVDGAAHERLRAQFPKLVSYAQPHGRFKLAAGWLIQEAGWKGRRIGPVGMHAQQALVLVNHGAATFADVMTLAEAVQASILEKFGVLLEREPVLIG